MGKELHILILEDAAADTELMERELHKGGIIFSSKRVETKENFLKELEEFAPDIILADYKLPSFSAIPALEIVKEKYPDIPFIIVSGTLGEELAIETLKKGATDYVLKDHLSRLAPAVKRALAEAEQKAASKHAEKMLKESEERYRTLFEASPDTILLQDLSANIVMVNKAGLKLYGYENLEEVIGRNIVSFVAQEDWPRARKDIQTLLETGGVKTLEYISYKKDDTPLPVELSALVVPDADGKPAAIICVVRDITERKKAEEALKEKDRAVRKVYIDVISAFTRGKLIIATPEEIKKSLGEPVNDTYAIRLEELAHARARLRKIIREQFPDIKEVDDIIIAVGEAVTNAIKHAGGGEYSIYMSGKTAQILISDSGPGIDFETLPKAALTSGFSTKLSLGLGFTLMLELSDRILLSTQPGNTTILLEKQ